ncbi:bifunctional riboflavin kinase/FAD synthetase [Croceicoccus sp. F390]|uniref:Riboflavin biosynthesis protein n=1 Tax=Croceicoccus esteveae TaxID=3075597 RepID=A0ABU2ZHY0_9SPHN|nr:bifunctional riboflavin kinase/FAD synthetase [Croceicoccus sp. F390]MDT0575796.1 bifunctional riboflavin kinase/FAD synthetase [Croceicoccus sp. F390]
MIRFAHTDPLPPSLADATIALGNFDGVHRGHQDVIGTAVADARAHGRPAIVATFDPHPVRYFLPDTPPFRLTTLDQREELFAALDVDAMLVFNFDRDLAQTNAEDFVSRLLVRDLRARCVVTGSDFTFGQGRTGDCDVLSRLGPPLGLASIRVQPVANGSAVISSSRIREALVAGEPEEATRLLTRPFTIRGVVQHGDKRGRTIGYPTANLDLGSYLRPRYGIYAVTGHLPGGRVVKGAANVGIRPSFDPPKELLEPHFFDFAGDLYGQEIDVAFHHFIRPEARFDTLEALTAQMAADCDRAKALLAG